MVCGMGKYFNCVKFEIGSFENLETTGFFQVGKNEIERDENGKHCSEIRNL